MWWTVVLVVGIYLVAAEECPGGKKTCNHGMTCCELPSGEQGCCPYGNATCCSDKVHCCPHGYNCLTGHCQSYYENTYTEVTKLMMDYEGPPEKLEREFHQSPNSSVTMYCPDGNQCTVGSICCKVSSHSYGCCPFSDGVCCKDLRTCCPSKHLCSPGGWCEPLVAGDSLKPLKQVPINTICPGGRQSCPAGNTCCPYGYGQWSCCPLSAATCCADQQHCCPHDYHCTDTGYCVRIDSKN